MNQELTIISQSPLQTLAIGELIGQWAYANQIIALMGPLGAGKTQLTKGLALGLGVVDQRQVTSPTFCIVNEYSGRMVLYHIDAYRLGGPSELSALGFEEMCQSGGLVVVEWADKIGELLVTEHLAVTLSVVGDQARQMRFQAPESISTRLFQLLEGKQ